MSASRTIARATQRRRSFPLLGLALGLAILMLLAPVASARVGDYSCSDPSKVYYGNHRLFQRPCTVSCDQVYDRISEYQEIVRKGYTAKDPKYHFLMKKASKRFSDAVKKMAVKYRHDLVACAGAISQEREKAKAIPDRTSECIKALE
jgi:hypothetical protein